MRSLLSGRWFHGDRFSWNNLHRINVRLMAGLRAFHAFLMVRERPLSKQAN